MSNNFSSLVVNDLESFQFIGGDQKELIFEVNEGGVPVDLTNSTASVEFSPYGSNNYVAFSVPGVVSGSQINIFSATISSSATATLSGKYTMQPVIIDENNIEHRPSQGIVLIIGRNATV